MCRIRFSERLAVPPWSMRIQPLPLPTANYSAQRRRGRASAVTTLSAAGTPSPPSPAKGPLKLRRLRVFARAALTTVPRTALQFAFPACAARDLRGGMPIRAVSRTLERSVRRQHDTGWLIGHLRARHAFVVAALSLGMLVAQGTAAGRRGNWQKAGCRALRFLSLVYGSQPLDVAVA